MDPSHSKAGQKPATRSVDLVEGTEILGYEPAMMFAVEHWMNLP